MNKKNKKNVLPKDGFTGLKENFSADALSGFLVFLLALPLSLGIAGASNFPPIFGLVTAMIGGLVISLFAGSLLTIKGPAAGLIVIVAGSVTELGHGNNELGWQLTLGAVVIAGILQIIFGILKLGSLSDFFPLSAVHGMLAAIGIIIISKQLHVLAGLNPLTAEGRPMVEPIELLLELKNTLANFFMHKDVVMIGLVCLLIVFGWPLIPNKTIRKIPSALIVLLVSVPLGILFDIHNTKDFTPLLEFNKGFTEIIAVNANFDGFAELGTFIKYICMFALVGSLESLLTIKAIDELDSYKRRSNTNKDLIAVGIGNVIAGFLGGLPMISEVARSSANVNNGAKTRWANFYHGLFILIFLIFAVSFSNLIPKAALAAMLIGVGWKLTHPREFGHMAKIGKDQIAIFITTILFILITDLLIGIGIGILLKLIIHIARGVKPSNLFKANTEVNGNIIIIRNAAIFSNFTKIKKQIHSFEFTEHIILDLSGCFLVDHSVIENLYHIKNDFATECGSFTILGLDEFKNIGNSSHQLSAKKKIK